MVILLLPLIQEGLFSVLQAKVCAWSTGKPLSLSLHRKIVIMLTDCLNMTIAVKSQTKQAKQQPQHEYTKYN